MASIVPAMALHEELYIDAPVSEQLLERIESHLVPQILGWNPEFRNVTIRAKDIVSAQIPDMRTEVGSFFLEGWTPGTH